MSFSPASYLQGLGWKGPGKGLTDAPHARSKPVIIAQKKTLSGVGKDRDTAFPWWEMVFASVASKSSEKTELHRTSTGIISNKPAPKPSAYASGDAPLLASTSRLNMDAFSLAKVEAARRELYSSFLRGQVLGGSADEEKETSQNDVKGKKRKLEEDEEEIEEVEESEKERKRRLKSEKRAKKEEAAKLSKSFATSISPSLPTPSSSPSPPPEKKLKKSKSSKKTKDHLSPEESIAAEELAYKEIKEAARRAEKEEKRLRKVVKKALKEKKGKKEGK